MLKFIVWNMDRARPANEGVAVSYKLANLLADSLENVTGDNYAVIPCRCPATHG